MKALSCQWLNDVTMPLVCAAAGLIKAINDVSSPLLYHILSKPSAFSDPFILDVVSAQPFLPRTVDWPMEPPAPGYFLLVVHEDKDIRDWAAGHLTEVKPIPLESIGANYDLVLRILLNRIAGKDHVNASGDSGLLSPLAARIDSAYRFAESQTDIWAGFCSMLRLIPGDIYESFGIHRIVIGHLHDNGPRASLFAATRLNCLTSVWSL